MHPQDTVFPGGWEKPKCSHKRQPPKYQVHHSPAKGRPYVSSTQPQEPEEVTPLWQLSAACQPLQPLIRVPIHKFWRKTSYLHHSIRSREKEVKAESKCNTKRSSHRPSAIKMHREFHNVEEKLDTRRRENENRRMYRCTNVKRGAQIASAVGTRGDTVSECF